MLIILAQWNAQDGALQSIFLNKRSMFELKWCQPGDGCEVNAFLRKIIYSRISLSRL